ncbi:hypothetical protein L6164_018890 [Bauhinia variegata]|uniref:Uncharacterized protein n=1 Tax=Bauhinia variegata TaxID=167791 RepID=A0ACB9NDV4_BAUVA|nr:hypothetical protein L6164_018890 [Bauhinia variegata]
MELQRKGFTPMPRKARSAELQVAGETDDNSEEQENDNTREQETSSTSAGGARIEGSSAESIAALVKVDTVKQRISTVEDVFASGDLPRAAETLANMRHCLSAVGEVAEFANIRKQVEDLEDRLDSMVQPRLTDALSDHKVAEFANIRKQLEVLEDSTSNHGSMTGDPHTFVDLSMKIEEVGCALHKTVGYGPRIQDEEGRLRFHFQSFDAASNEISSNYATRQIESLSQQNLGRRGKLSIGEEEREMSSGKRQGEEHHVIECRKDKEIGTCGC